MILAPETILQKRYKVIRLLGQGGMGAVYEAVDQHTGTTVALKQALVTDKTLSKAFEREARILTRLRHPSLPIVSDCFTNDYGQFLVMQYIPGDDLGTLLEKKRDRFLREHAIPWVLQWADQLLDALTYLHTQNPPILHRDIKPQNLKITPEGTVMLLDFGMAKSAADQTRRSVVQSIRGYSEQYAPLEQIQGIGTQPSSDIYSLAATLYHLFTGEAPPDALTRVAAVLEGHPDPLRSAQELNPFVPPIIALVLHQALAQKITERFVSAAALRKALQMSNPGISTSTSGQRAVQTSQSSGNQNRGKPLGKPGTSNLPGVVDIQFNSSGLQTVVSSPSHSGGQVTMGVPFTTTMADGREQETRGDGDKSAVSMGQDEAAIDTADHTASLAQPTLVVSQQGDGDYTTINEAIANAEPGTRIYIRPGTYTEGIILTKSLEIIGDGATDEVIVESIGLQCLQMRTDYARVRGLTLRERAGPIAIDIPQGRLIMEECDISSDTPICVVVQNSETRPMFYRCKIHDVPGIGMLFYKWSQGTVDSCEICHNDLAGIKIAQNSNPHVRQTSVHHNGYAGVHISDSGRGLIDSCIITQNDLDAIEITNDANPCIRNCTLRDQVHGGGISVYDSGRGIIEACTIVSSSNVGIQISQFGNPYFRRCTVRTTKQHSLVVKDQGRGVLDRCHFYCNLESPLAVEREEDLVITKCTINSMGCEERTLWDNSPVPSPQQGIPLVPLKEKEQAAAATSSVAWSTVQQAAVYH